MTTHGENAGMTACCICRWLRIFGAESEYLHLSQIQEQLHRWHSPILGIEMEMLTFGTRGFPVVLFPTSMGMHNENRDFNLIDSIAWFIEEGLVKVYCPDGIDRYSWYNDQADPMQRVQNHILYDRMLMEELYPHMKHETGNWRFGSAGCSFGGFHAANLAFRHPHEVAGLFSFSAKFDIRSRIDGFYNDDIYYNNPVDYLPDLQDPWLWKMQIFLGSAEFDICLDANYKMAHMLGIKQVPHTLDVMPGEKHDWPLWRKQFPKFLGMFDFHAIYPHTTSTQTDQR